MATTTTNLSLRKPESADFVSVALDISGNMQTIDEKWATSAAADIGASAAAGSALTVARTDHVHKVGSGTVSAPGLPIGESNSGFYRIGSANIGAAIAGALSWAYSATGIAIETALALKHVASVTATSGYIKLFAKSDENLYKHTGAGDEVRILDADIFTAQGDLVYGTAAETFTQLAKGTAYQELVMNSGATAPSWVTGVTKLAAAAGDTFYATAANTLAKLSAGTARQVLAMNAAATAPEWVASPQSLMTTTGDMLYASAANTPARLAAVAAGNVLRAAGTGTAPAWGQILNADISTSAAIEMLKMASYAVGCRSNSATSVANSGLTAIAFGSQILAKTPSGYTALHDTVTNNTRISISKAGLYLFIGIIGFASSTAVNYRGAQFVKNGATSLGANNIQPVGGGAFTTVLAFGMSSLAVSDYVELYGAQDTSGALNAASGESYMYAVYLGG